MATGIPPPFDEWTETFGTERLTGALLDRLTHHVKVRGSLSVSILCSSMIDSSGKAQEPDAVSAVFNGTFDKRHTLCPDNSVVIRKSFRCLRFGLVVSLPSWGDFQMHCGNCSCECGDGVWKSAYSRAGMIVRTVGAGRDAREGSRHVWRARSPSLRDGRTPLRLSNRSNSSRKRRYRNTATSSIPQTGTCKRPRGRM